MASTVQWLQPTSPAGHAAAADSGRSFPFKKAPPLGLFLAQLATFCLPCVRTTRQHGFAMLHAVYQAGRCHSLPRLCPPAVQAS